MLYGTSLKFRCVWRHVHTIALVICRSLFLPIVNVQFQQKEIYQKTFIMFSFHFIIFCKRICFFFLCLFHDYFDDELYFSIQLFIYLISLMNYYLFFSPVIPKIVSSFSSFVFVEAMHFFQDYLLLLFHFCKLLFLWINFFVGMYEMYIISFCQVLTRSPAISDNNLLYFFVGVFH